VLGDPNMGGAPRGSEASSRKVCAVWGQHNCGLYSTGLAQRLKKVVIICKFLMEVSVCIT